MRLTLAVTLLLLVPAAARAEWSGGQTLSGPHTFVDDPAVIVSGDGGALASWRYQQGLGNGSRAGYEGAARAPGATGFGARVGIVRATSVNRPLTTLAGLAPYGAGGALQALTLPGPDDRPQARIGVRFGSTDG